MIRPTEYHWVFGARNHVEFPAGGAPVNMLISDPAQIDTVEGCASISDTAGNLLFYTDGKGLWDASHTQVNTVDLGGSASATHSAIIVPPPPGGQIYHVFTVGDWDQRNYPNTTPLQHTQVTLNPITITSTAVTVANSPPRVGEQLIAVPTQDCAGWWVLCMGFDDKEILAFELRGDAGIVQGPVRSSYPDPYFGFCAKASADGNWLGFTNPKNHKVEFFQFDRATGTASFAFDVDTNGNNSRRVYGLEFSENSQFAFYSSLNMPQIHCVDLTTRAVTLLGSIGRGKFGALQMGPDGKIYGAKENQATLACIDQPDLGPGATLIRDAVDANGQVIVIENSNQNLGLPTFTRLSQDCVNGSCDALADSVNETLLGIADDHHNSMRHCDAQDQQDRDDRNARCTPIDLPEIKPSYHITWGDSKCDDVESDDVEVMTLTICNPYSNVTLSHMTVHKLTVTDSSGNPVGTLPDGTPSVTLVPIGPYCFGDVEPCSCVSRAFTLRTRGAKDGHYKINVEGICFDVCTHQDARTCFTFHICKD